MRIAVVTTSYPSAPDDGAGHFVRSEVRALLAAGHDVTVLTPGASDARTPQSSGATSSQFSSMAFERLEHLTRLGGSRAFGWPGALARLSRRPWVAIDAAAFVSRARRVLLRERFDHVVAHWLVPSAWPIACGIDSAREHARRGPPTLEAVAHGSDVRLLLRMPRALRERILRTLITEDVRLRFVSGELRDLLQASTTLPIADRAAVAPAAIDVDGVPNRALARQRLGISDEIRLVVVPGRLVSSKRTEVALSGARLLPRTRVAVVGDGPEGERLRARFPQVEFKGHLSRSLALTWIAAADVVVSASRSEGAPTVIREARALGVPVVCTPSGDVAEWAARDPELYVIRASQANQP